LGKLYLTGNGVPSDPQLAEKWLKKAAGQDDPFAEYLLGVLYSNRDYTAAPQWFQKAAEQGLPQAQRKLGLLYKEGRGVPEDKLKAYVWLLTSYEAGERSAAPDLQELEAQLGSSQVENAKATARDYESKYSRRVLAAGCTGWDGEFDEIPTPPPPKIQRYCR